MSRSSDAFQNVPFESGHLGQRMDASLS